MHKEDTTVTTACIQVVRSMCHVSILPFIIRLHCYADYRADELATRLCKAAALTCCLVPERLEPLHELCVVQRAPLDQL